MASSYRAAIIIGGLCLASPSLAAPRCTEGLKAIVEAQGKTWTMLTPDQWQFLRGVSVLAPDMPSGLPPGDGAAFVQESGADYGWIVFTEGSSGCWPVMPVPKELVQILMSVGKGDIIHPGHEM